MVLAHRVLLWNCRVLGEVMVSILHGWEYGAKRAKMKWLSNRKFLQRRPETNPTYAGNTLRTMTTIFSNKGATPRMRGKAHEQRQNRRPSAEQPRMCGEYRSSAHSSTMDSGTPPRARGIVRVPAICTVCDRNNPAGAGNTWGEIGVRRLPGGVNPAHAGNTDGATTTMFRLKGQPRMCGE